MTCCKYILTNTGSTIVTFNYQRCDDSLWEYQMELLPNETKNIWLLEETYHAAVYFSQFIVIQKECPFPPTGITPTPTPSGTPIPVTPTPSVTPTETPIPSVTPTITPTTTLTPTPTTNRNLIISNTSSNNYIINLTDNSGIWYLTDQVGSFIVGPGQMLYANHDTTDNNPRCTITYSGSYNFKVKINGVVTSDWSGSGSAAGLARVLRTASPSTPIDASEIVYIEITD